MGNPTGPSGANSILVAMHQTLRNTVFLVCDAVGRLFVRICGEDAEGEAVAIRTTDDGAVHAEITNAAGDPVPAEIAVPLPGSDATRDAQQTESSWEYVPLAAAAGTNVISSGECIFGGVVIGTVWTEPVVTVHNSNSANNVLIGPVIPVSKELISAVPGGIRCPNGLTVVIAGTGTVSGFVAVRPIGSGG